MSVCDHCQYCSYCHGDVNRLKNIIKDLNDENERLVFDLSNAVMDAKNTRWLLAQAKDKIDVKNECDCYREAGAVLLRAIYESGIAYGDAEIASALAVFAND